MKMSLIPMIPVQSLDRSIGFYEKLGFSVEQRRDDWGWAMLCLGDCKIMIDRSINARPGAARDAVLYLYPSDIRAYHRQVRGAGLSIPDLDTTFYGLTEFRLDDPDGNRMWIGQREANGDGTA
jgi:catechol 2,3-dioxygenase-like lactoylglutathione lyase family enzyme